MKDRYNAKQIKEQASIITMLAALGHHPVRTTGGEAYYISPIREEDTASFAVQDATGVWCDLGDTNDKGKVKGGNIIDLAICIWPRLTFPEVLEEIARRTEITPENITQQYVPKPKVPLPKEPSYHILEIRDIDANQAIAAYLESRAVLHEAKSLLKEVYYYLTAEKKGRKNFFAAGWQNETGAWEVSTVGRRKYCLGQKAISYIPGDNKQLAVFEGMFDYLSWRAENAFATSSALILNSVALMLPGIDKARGFENIELYFDHDPAGRKATLGFLEALPQSTDRSGIYLGYNDYNEKLEAEYQAQSRERAY